MSVVERSEVDQDKNEITVFTKIFQKLISFSFALLIFQLSYFKKCPDLRTSNFISLDRPGT